MKTRLPLADDIRDARAAHVEAVQARRHLQQAGTALEAVDAVQKQFARSPDAPRGIPGEALIGELAEAWPILGDLHSAGPRAASPIPQQLGARRSQLGLAQQVLRPIARELAARLERMHALQLVQQEQLDNPAYGPVLSEIQALNAERDGVIGEFQPLKQRLGIVEPILGLLDNFIANLERDHAAGRSTPDPAGAVAWRTAYLAENVLRSVEGVLSSVDFGVPIPAIPPLPAQPDPAQSEARWAEVTTALTGMHALRAAIRTQADEMTARAEAAWERYEVISAQILDLTG